MSDLVSSLDDEFEVQDPEEECFLLFLNKPDNRDLGFVNRTESTVSVSINSQDLTIHQSPSLLTSTRETGTTGAVLWKVTPLLASWLTHPCNTVSRRILKPHYTVIELGAGTSGVLAVSFAPFVGAYYATDQEYCLKLLRKNISENYKENLGNPSKSKEKYSNKRTKRGTETSSQTSTGNATVLPLDWQLTEVSSIPEFKAKKIDVIIAADCIYNEFLVEPLVDTMADLSKLNRDETATGETDHNVTLVIVAQELRSPGVLEAFMKAFCAKFRVWRLPDKLYKGCGDGGKGLMEDGGYVVHVGILK
ncbi:uncharacterized protein DFL_008238 [Arthrobotrys flagrans]|uniref:Uncharacterized protein n=1 Tax=Arthrobotrys flagrans TaxID=97331 RepID=A0A436ZN66_ARTFL|nr:hypothetical protein DFL_008238 [Arthrobotrys flagrans]